MILTPKSRLILAQLGLHADLSIPEAAKKVGLPVHQLRYELSRLQELGVITLRAAVDVFALGWQRAQLFLSMAGKTPALREKLVQRLCSHASIPFVADTAGEFDLEVVCLVRGVAQISRIMEEVGLTEQVKVVGKALAFHQNLTFFPRKYLVAKPQFDQVKLGAGTQTFEIDDLDHNILCLYSAHPDITQQELAQEVGVSVVTVGVRLRSMRERGILPGLMWSVSGEKIGSQNFILLIEAQGYDSGLAAELHAFCRTHPNCTNFRRAIGNWDLEIGVELEHPSELLPLKDTLAHRFSDRITRIQVLNRINIRKYQQFPFTPLKLKRH